MPNEELTRNDLSFLSGGGEMGELMRSKDWSVTTIGDPHSWPQSLRTTLSIILHSKFPMFLFWGPEHICFYNDAYRPSLGENGKHPECLGKKGKEVWPEIWEDIFPLITQVLSGGEATWAEDQLLPIFRNGKLEDVYWTFSYSPVTNEAGTIAGVFVTCTETTSKINAFKKLQDSMDFLQFATESSELGTWDYNPQTNKFTSNNRLKDWFGLPHKAEIELDHAISIIHPHDRERTTNAIKRALDYSSGGYYDIEYTIIHPLKKTEIIVHAKGRAWFTEDKIAYRFNGIMQDITLQSLASRALQQSEEKFRHTIEQAPLGITILKGKDYIVEMANSTYLDIINKTSGEFVGKPLFHSLPEVKDAVENILQSVLETGKPYRGVEFPVYLNQNGKNVLTYFNFVYQPLLQNNGEIAGIIVVASDVTESVLAKHDLSESERRFRSMVMQSPIPMTILRGKDYIIETANNVMFEAVWRKKENEVIGRPILKVFPELMEQKYPELLKKVFTTGVMHTEKESVAFVMGDDGMKKFYLDFEYAPLLDPEQNISGIIITVNDVTEKVEARLAVEESEQKLNLVIDASELGTWELNMQTEEMNYSDRFVQMFGFDASAKVTHQQLLKRLHPDDMTVRNTAFEKAIATGFLHYESRILWPNGIQRWMEVKGKISLDENGKPLSLIGTTRDTTDEKYHQQEMEDRERKFRLLADAMPQLV
ncbi:MAG: PAS domain S-box protein, partial [Sphingobacteriales bacterium]